MVLRKILQKFGIQLEHIYRFNKDGSFMARYTQIDNTQLPVTGLYGKSVLPYFDTDTTIVYERDSVIKEIIFQGGDFNEKYTLNATDFTFKINGEGLYKEWK